MTPVLSVSVNILLAPLMNLYDLNAEKEARKNTAMDNFVHKPNLALWNRFNENYDKALSARASKLKPDKMKQLISLDKW